jgi:leucyl-tRNA synthetase
MDYKPQALDAKWQRRWTAARAFEVSEDPARPKYYCLEMFAYPSGHAHVGHVRNYIIGDVMARTKRLRGYNVLHPFGWDAFGLPAENAAIKSGIHPETSTLANIAHMKGQLQRLGISYAWDREFATCEPTYYKWNQWLFIKMYERGLAYRRRSSVNWCEKDQTVLANEQVVDGGCWRCGTPVTTRDLEQWFFKITHYADDLLTGIEQLGRQWPEKVLTMQRTGSGRSQGTRIKFPVLAGAGLGGRVGHDRSVYDEDSTRFFGATCVFLAPEHEMVEKFAMLSEDPAAFRKKATSFRTQDRTARLTGEIEKEGFFTGRYAQNPFTEERIPIWIANFVLGEYGTGAVMAVPAHDQRDFEFATKYNLPIKVVVHPIRIRARPKTSMRPSRTTAASSIPGVHGLTSSALARMGEWVEKKGSASGRCSSV